MRFFCSGILAVAIASAAVSCSKPADRVEITESATRSETRDVPRVNATSDERFARVRPAGQQAQAPGAVPQESTTAGSTPAPAATPELPPMASDAGSSGLAYSVPASWTEIAATPFRNPNFIAGPNNDIECYVSVLGGDGGGLMVNANRWRGQLGKPPWSDAEFAQLPRASILGNEAVIVDFDGDFTGMGADEVKHGYRLVGALLTARDSAVFIKMVGPDAAVNAEKDNFARFAQSLRFADAQSGQAAPSAPSAPAAPAPAPPAAQNSAYTWETPPGWNVDPAGSSMRLVTLRFGPNNAGECYVAVLPGAAGGRLDNFNRWLAQLGQPPLVETELDLQPTVFLFDEEVPLLIAGGTYTGMGGESRPDHTMFGAIATVGEESVFIKLIAPQSFANEHLNAFRRFCASLKKA